MLNLPGRHDRDAGVVLPNYYAILAGKRSAKYLRAKRIPVPGGLEGTDNELVVRHTDTLKKMEDITSVPDELEDIPQRGNSLFNLKLELARRYFKSCNYCERNCKVDRDVESGVCGVTESLISSEFLHYGEEPELVPSYTIFFAGCTFKCDFCQNWDISQDPQSGVTVEPKKIAKMIERNTGRARNTNWVGGDPTSNLKYILEVLKHCYANIPQVWNSNMYLTESTMALLDGVIDVYLTDFKYGPGDCAKRLSKVENYWPIITRNHKLANEQAEMIIRHLVLPNHFECCTKPILKWIAGNLDNSKVRVNIMDQYRPEYRARKHDELVRKLKLAEFTTVISYGRDLGLNLVV